jgi:hypothetical protein
MKKDEQQKGGTLVVVYAEPLGNVVTDWPVYPTGVDQPAEPKNFYYFLNIFFTIYLWAAASKTGLKALQSGSSLS